MSWLQRVLRKVFGPPRETSPRRADLEQRAGDVARKLGLAWDGISATAHREQLPDGRAVWRVYQLSPGFAERVVFDANSDELLAIEEAPPDRDVHFPPLPPKFVPDEAELLAFARGKLVVLGWSVTEPMVVRQGETDKDWIIEATGPDGSVSVRLRGRRRSLHLTGASRV